MNQINCISHCWVSLDPKKKLKFALESFWDGKSSAEDSVIHLKTRLMQALSTSQQHILSTQPQCLVPSHNQANFWDA
uniref:Pentatricopeptide repeat-containing protein n=1 Tax=Solanum tuberosum TaxID=4113 RepID=M1CUJ0_SOLTU